MQDNVDIRVRGVVKKYGNRADVAVDHIDLDVRSGEFLGLLGPNGAGKTTLISIITGVRTASEGSVLIKGHDVASIPDVAHECIGFVPQNIALYEMLTARENLAFFGKLHGMDAQTIRERSDHLLERAGLLARAHERVGTWSGGMQRRLNLITALLHGPAIIFLDEPTVGIDIQSRTAIWVLLEEINKAGTTIVYTSHHLEEAARLCSRVVIMDQGRIVGEVTDTKGHGGTERLEEVFLGLTGMEYRDH
ncbi:MAG: ABC transporter ATP-binding protein [Flavobacteriales bacterium]|nr:ABC transporter ATP-binding protein [Flavobacteriales bacterium]